MSNSITAHAHRAPRAREAALPETPALLAELVKLLLQEARHDEARQILAALAVLRPGDPCFELLDGLLAFAEGHYRVAEASYQRLLANDPHYQIARAFLAECLIAQRRWREAEAMIGEVRRGRPDASAERLVNGLADGLAQGLFQSSAAGR